MEQGVGKSIEAPSTVRSSRGKRIERAVLNGQCCETVDAWIEQVKARARGIRINRNALVQWLIEGRASTLSESEICEIAEKYFDEVRFARWVVDELRVARSKGENVSLAELVARNSLTSPKKRARRRRVSGLSKDLSENAAEAKSPEKS